MRTMKEKDPEAEYRKSVANACPGRVHCRLIPKVRKGVPARNVKKVWTTACSPCIRNGSRAGMPTQGRPDMNRKYPRRLSVKRKKSTCSCWIMHREIQSEALEQNVRS